MSLLYDTFICIGVSHYYIWYLNCALTYACYFTGEDRVKELFVWPSIFRKEMGWLMKIFPLGELSYLILMWPHGGRVGCIINSWCSALMLQHLMNCCLHKLFMC